MITQFKIKTPDDMHVHLREGDLMKEVLPHTAGRFRRALVMPNLIDPVTDGTKVAAYRNRIYDASRVLNVDFTPLMTLKLTQRTTPGTIQRSVVKAVKVYPEGVTTNSSDGVYSLDTIAPDVFRAMVDYGMVLCIHAEEPGAFSLRTLRMANQSPRSPIISGNTSTENRRIARSS